MAYQDLFASRRSTPYMGPTNVPTVATTLPTPTPLPIASNPVAGGPVGPVANPLRPYTGIGPMPGTAQGSPRETGLGPAPLTGVQTPMQARASSILGVRGAPVTHRTPGFADTPYIPATPPTLRPEQTLVQARPGAARLLGVRR